MPEHIVQLCLRDWGMWTQPEVAAVALVVFVLGVVNGEWRAKRRRKREMRAHLGERKAQDDNDQS